MKKIKKPVWIAILCVSLAVIAGATVYLIRYCGQGDVSRDDFKPKTKATEEVGTTQPTPVSTVEPTVYAWGYKPVQPAQLDVSFEELMQINPDIYAWIYIPNTEVDYPVARSTSDGDDSFYLEHNIYRQYQFSGTIYSEIKNQPDMHDPVTVMYGHNMLNGSMFATLHYFEDPDFFDQNNTIFIYTKDKVFTYLVYSAYTYDDRHILNTMNMKNNQVFWRYLDSTLHPHSVDANVREGVELTTDNRILTLSTCTSGAANTRYLVQGVLVDERYR